MGVQRQESALEVYQPHRLGQDFHQPPVPLFAGSQRRRGIPQTHHGPNSRQKFRHFQRFRQVIIRPQAQAVHFAGSAYGRAGSQHHKNIRQGGVGLDLPADIHAVAVGQHDIQEHQIRAAFAHRLEARLAGGGLPHLIAFDAQDRGIHIEDRGLIVHYKYASRLVHTANPCLVDIK